MNTRKLLFYTVAVLLGGCVPVMSLHSLYTEKDVVFEEKLLGTWADDPNSPDTTWEFKRIDEPNNAYNLIFSDKEGRKGSFVAHLVKLQNRLFLDVYPSGLPWELQEPNEVDWPYNSLLLMPAHTVIKIDSIEPQLKIALTLESKMKELFKEDPNAIKHTFVEDKPVLTALTEELQAFVLKYADDDRVFAGEIVLNRRSDRDPNAPGPVKPTTSQKEESDK